MAKSTLGFFPFDSLHFPLSSLPSSLLPFLLPLSYDAFFATSYNCQWFKKPRALKKSMYCAKTCSRTVNVDTSTIGQNYRSVNRSKHNHASPRDQDLKDGWGQRLGGSWP